MQPQNPVPVPPPLPQNPSPPPSPEPPAPVPETEVEIPQPLKVEMVDSPGDIAGDEELLEPGEHLVTVVHRSLVGIVIIYLEILVAIVAILALVYLLAPNFIQNLSGQTYRLFLAGVFMAVVLLALMLFVATYIYRQCRLIVSDKSLIQILQNGLFVRKVSRLSMSNVQDVEASHVGILASLFGYGTLTIETAGEEDNFVFPYCPSPDIYAQRILDARQKYVQTLDTAERAAEPG